MLRDIALGYPGRLLYEGIDIAFRPGELTALVGRNGAGKSTLLRTLAGLLQPLRGEVSLGGRPLGEMSVREVAAQVSFVSTEEVRVGDLSVYDVVGLGRAPYTNWIGRLGAEDRRRVDEALELVGMSAFARKGIDSLSDGERQRVMIARSLAQDTPVILLDEPTAFLDLPNKYEIVLLLRRLAHDHGKTILASTHDLNIALEQCDRIVMIDGGRFIESRPADMIADGTIQRLFEGTILRYDSEKGRISIREEKK